MSLHFELCCVFLERAYSPMPVCLRSRRRVDPSRPLNAHSLAVSLFSGVQRFWSSGNEMVPSSWSWILVDWLPCDLRSMGEAMRLLRAEDACRTSVGCPRLELQPMLEQFLLSVRRLSAQPCLGSPLSLWQRSYSIGLKANES